MCKFDDEAVWTLGLVALLMPSCCEQFSNTASEHQMVDADINWGGGWPAKW